MTDSQPDLQAFLSHRDFVRSLAQSLLSSPADVDDVEQRTWITAMGDSARSVRDPRSWLAQVVRNHAMQVRRTAQRFRRRESEVARPEPTEGGQGLIDRMETSRALVEAVMRLAEPSRTALLMRYYEEKSVATIARELGVRSGMVKGRIQRGLAELRVALAKSDADAGHTWRRDLAVLLAPLPLRESAAVSGWVGLAAALGLLAIPVWWVSREDPLEKETALALAGETAAPLSAPRAELRSIPERTSVPPVASAPANEALAPAVTARVELNVPVPEAEPELPAAALDDWVEELRKLAEDPARFHELAIEIVQRQRRLGLEKEGRRRPLSWTESRDLLDRLILDPDEPELVRGGVFLALAERMSPDQFRRVFDDWLGRQDERYELVRAAAIAASWRGTSAACDVHLELGAIWGLELSIGETQDTGKTYPVALSRYPGEYEASVLRRWFKQDRTEILEHLLAPGGREEQELSRLASDCLSASGVVCAALGIESVESPEVERWLIDEITRFDSSAEDYEQYFRLLSVIYTIYALAPCSERFRSVLTDPSAITDPMAQAMLALVLEAAERGSAAGNLAAELRGVRGPRRRKLVKALAQVEAHVEGGGEVADALYFELHAVVLDPKVKGAYRQRALDSIGTGASWLDYARTAAEALRQGSDKKLMAQVIAQLEEVADEFHDRRPKIAVILEAGLESHLSGALAQKAQVLLNRIRP